MKNNPFSLWAVCCLLLLGVTACDQCKVEIGKLPDQPVTPQPNPLRPPAELPPATQHGANTFGCRINGENWVFWIPPIALTDETSFLVSEDNGYGSTNCQVRVWRDTLVNNKVLYHDLIFSFQNPFLEPKTYVKAGGKGLNLDNFSFTLSIGNQGKWYVPDSSNLVNNRIFIDRLDVDSNIIAGRFNLVLYHGYNYSILDRTDSVVISDGRFDFIYDED